MLLHGPFKITTNFDLSVYIGPTSVSLYKWTLYMDGGIFMADQVARDRQWALILVAGGDEAYNRWDILEETVKNKEDVDQVWQAFEKSFE